MGGYRDLLRHRYVLTALAANLFGRLPNGMTALALTLLFRAQGASFAWVGVLVACFGLASAAGGPFLARLVDRQGQPAVLGISAVVSSAALAGLAWSARPALWLSSTLVIIAGASVPPLEACLRSVWKALLPAKLLQRAYSLDASLQEVLFVAGPLLTVAVATLAGSPRWAVLSIAVINVVGAVAFGALPPVRTWRPAAVRHSDWLGPLRSAPLRQVYLVFVFVGIAIGVLGVAAVGYAERAGHDQLSGVLLGLHAVGALAGGLTYGGLAVSRGPGKQLPWLITALAVCYLPLSLAPGPVVMGPLMAVAGVFLAPALACCFAVIGSLAPEGTQTEAFAWVVSVFSTGIAVGSALAGSTLGAAGVHAAFLLAGGAGVLATLVAHVRVVQPVIGSQPKV